MRKRASIICAGVVSLSLVAVYAFSQATALPSAPESSEEVSNTHTAKWSEVVEPGERATPLSTKDKLLFPIHEELQPMRWFPTFSSAGWEQLIDGHPKYGTDSGAYSQRVGAAAIRDLSMRTFSDGILPVLTHEDPRYFRIGEGTLVHRGLYAASRVFIGPRDSGDIRFNSSVIIGHGMASALTLAYYPSASAKGSVVFETFGFSLLGKAAGNLWSEFWPDTRNRLFHRPSDPSR